MKNIKYLTTPDKCPICGGNTAIQKDNESEVLVCTNPNCKGKLLGKFTSFVSKKAMNIDGLSTETLSLLINNGYLNDFIDIYGLFKYRDKLVTLPGLGPKSVEKLLLSIENSRNVKLENFICALGIPNVGVSASKTISNKFNGDYNSFIRAYRDCFEWDWIDDIGTVTAVNIDYYLDNHFDCIQLLAAEINFVVPEKNKTIDNPFAGKTVVVTGKLNHFNRDSINEKIASLGAKTSGSVSKKTDYLITNEASGSSKYKKAVEFGVPVITEDEFLKMIEA